MAEVEGLEDGVGESRHTGEGDALQNYLYRWLCGLSLDDCTGFLRNDNFCTTLRHAMTKKRKIFAVGDIHGCFQKLRTLMGRLPIDPDEDLLVFIGDYINRGAQSKDVIEYLLETRSRIRDTVFLLGNHEHALLQFCSTGDLEYLKIGRAMGVESTLESYSGSAVNSLCDLSFLPPGHREFMEDLLPWYEEEGYLFIHAGVIPGEDYRESRLDRLLSVRNVFLESAPADDSVIVFGHTPFSTPLVTRGKIGIDTGAVYGNMLTAVELPRLRFYHA